MGLQNVDLVHEQWGHLRGDSFRALEWMALRAWDAGQERAGDSPRRYWGGHQLLAFGMGLIAKRDTPLNHSNAERVRRTVRTLAKDHAIAVLEQGKGKQHAVYELQFRLPLSPVDISDGPPQIVGGHETTSPPTI